MARKMNSDKSGVMIYFSPMRKEAHDLDDARLGRLFRAILDFADPESPVSGTDPDFGDETLNHVWNFVQDAVTRDDNTYTEKSLNRKYSNYVRWSKENKAYIMEREEWRNAGCPSFLEIKKRLVQMDPSGSKWIQMDFFYSIWNTISNSSANTISSSNAESTTVSVSDAERWSSPTLEDVASDDTPNDIDNHDMPDRDAYASDDEWIEAIKNQCEESAKDLPPILRTSSWTTQEAFRKWICYWKSTNGRPMPEMSRNSLAERFRYYSELYSPPEVLDLIDAAIDSVYKSIPWDRLERNVRRN